jgi:hypothetical protein
VPSIVVRAQRLPIPSEFCAGDYARDPHTRKAVQRWLQGLWQEKDTEIEALLHPDAVTRT